MVYGLGMSEQSYLQWLAQETATDWWHDSANVDELKVGLEHKAVGVTINPVLVRKAVESNIGYWGSIFKTLPNDLTPQQRTEEMTKLVTQKVTPVMTEQFSKGDGKTGYVCAQVNPAMASDRETMIAMARRFNAWAPNIAVKLPATAAGLDVLEDCIAEGITITVTVSFTVPQLLAIAERHRKGITRAKQAGKTPGNCFAVLMIGRIDDYLRDVAHDRKSQVTESDIRQAGLAIAKRAYSVYKEKNYEAMMLVAALRGTYHMTELAGAELIMSIHPKYQQMLLEPGIDKQERIDNTIAAEVIQRLETIPDFVRAYKLDGMDAEEFITFGATQRTLSQFIETGWLSLQSFCQ